MAPKRLKDVRTPRAYSPVGADSARRPSILDRSWGGRRASTLQARLGAPRIGRAGGDDAALTAAEPDA